MGLSSSDQRKVDALLRETHANDGLAPVDLERFWADRAVANADPFGEGIPQCAMGDLWSRDCVFSEVGVDYDMTRYTRDAEWRIALNRAYNDRAERIVGRRLLPETPPDPQAVQWPQARGLHDIFEARQEWHTGSWWLMQSASGPGELAALLDRVEERLADLRAFCLPDDWDARKAAAAAAGARPRLYRDQRGPVTFATSVYGSEDLVFLIMDRPELARRFSDCILRAMLGLAELLDEEAGYTRETAPRGFGFRDDNCMLLNLEMYELFGYPILKGIWDRYAPDPGDWRYQHSDSPMAHVLPALGRLNLTACNFGPTVSVRQIREHMPHTVIHGVLAPFTLSRNDEAGIAGEFLRDFGQTREQRGLQFATAGSVNDGTRLTGARLAMAAIQRYGRYDD